MLQLHAILAMHKKVHFVLGIAGGGKMFSVMDVSSRMMKDLAWY